MRKKKRWLIAIAVVVALGLSYLGYSLFIHSEADYLAVGELKAQAESLSDQQVRIRGRVTPGSIDWDDKSGTMRFVLTDDKENLTVVYNGVVPDNFGPGADLVVAGRYRPDDVFEAQSFGRSRSLCNLCH